MKVKELIEILKNMDSEKEVYMPTTDGFRYSCKINVIESPYHIFFEEDSDK